MSESYFSRADLACKCGCKASYVADGMLDMLDRMRVSAGIPMEVTSGFRCKKHNDAIGGSPNSSHLRGFAVDIRVVGSANRLRLVDAALTVGFDRIGLADGFIHVDVDRTKVSNVLWLYPYKGVE